MLYCAELSARSGVCVQSRRIKPYINVPFIFRFANLKPRFFHTFLLLPALLCLVASCGRTPEPAPDYDNRRLTRLVEAVEAIRAQRTDDALTSLRALSDDYPADRFPAAAFRHEQKRQLLSQANALLSDLSLNLLLDFIRQAERNGDTFPELLDYSAIKDALDQLRLFHARMPWTHADTLERNLRDLNRHHAILNQSPTFREFHEQQLQTLRQLREQEQRHAEKTALDRLDRALVTNSATPQPLLQAARQQSPTLNTLLGQPAKLAQQQEQSGAASVLQASWELAAALSWDKLAAADQRRILARLAANRPVTLTGAWLATRHDAWPDAAQHFLQLLSARQAGTPRPDIVRLLLTHHLLSQAHYQAWCWRSPCPGVPELIARLTQIGQFHHASDNAPNGNPRGAKP